MSEEEKYISELTEVLDELVHACEDDFDDYGRIAKACEAAKKLLPSYVPLPDEEE